MAALSLLVLLGTFIAHTISPEQPWRLRYLAVQFDLARENNAAAWYASMLLLTVALAMTACFVLDLRSTNGRRGRILTLGWLALAVLFAGLSFDELGSLHERLTTVRIIDDLDIPTRIGLVGWVGILAVPGAIVVGLAIAFGWLRLRHSRSAFALMCFGFLLYATVPLQEAHETATWSAAEPRWVGFLLLEEGSELLASFCLLLAALRFAYTLAPVEADDERILLFRLNLDVLIALELGLALALAFVIFALPDIMDLRDDRGVPRNWFPAAMAFIITLCAAHAASRTSGGSRPLTAAAWLLMALVHLALSIDHGSSHRFTQQLLSGTPEVRSMLDAAIAVVIAAAAALLAYSARAWATRVAIAVWGALLLAAILLQAEQAWLAFGAYALLLPAIMTMLPHTTSTLRST